jgi:hypothetical protein
MPARMPGGLRVAAALLVAAIALLACGELFARYYLGLGHPPLSQTHPTIEYLFKPNQDVRRFGNWFRTNRYGMRSEEFPPQKRTPRELRVMVYGDSVVNGGNLTDQSRLATSYLQQTLTNDLQRPVVVGNISAGSWGPPNELAYLRQFGFLDADIVVLVLSSSDYDDAPTFEPLNPMTHPTQAPLSALWEGITRYLPRYINGKVINEAGQVPDAQRLPNTRDMEVSLSAEREFLETARAQAVKVLLVQHWTASELRNRQPLQGHAYIRRIATEGAVPISDDADKLQAQLDAGKNPFRDDIHLNDAGQLALAEFLLEQLRHNFSDILTPAATADRSEPVSAPH